MRAWEIQAFDLDRLVQVGRPDPRPGPGQVLIGVRAASLNYRDLLVVQGRYNPRQRLPLIPLSDGVGEVLEIGAGVSRVAPGDRVAGAFAQRWIAGEPTRARLRSTLGGPLDGMLAERVVLDEEGVVAVPPDLSDVEAATLPCAGVTAWSAVVRCGRIGPGDTVLVLGTGGVSIFALQIARLLGARVIVTSSREEKLERARALGAWETIHHPSQPDWDERVRELTDGLGADLVVEVGGAGTLARSLRATRVGGAVAMIGVLSGHAGEIDVRAIVMQKLRVEGVLVGSRDDFEALNRAVALHGMRPVVDRVFGWAEAREALGQLASGAHFGKLAIGF